MIRDLTVSSFTSKQILEVLLSKVDTLKLGNLFLQRVVLGLKLINLLFSHASSFISQFLAEVQVVRDGLLSFDFSLNLSNVFVIASLLRCSTFLSLDSETHLYELEEDFVVHKEINVYCCIITFSDVRLDIAYLFFVVLVNSVSNFPHKILFKLLWLGSSDS